MKKLLIPLAAIALAGLSAKAQQLPAVEISTTYANQGSPVNTYDQEFKLQKPGSGLVWTAKNFNNNSIGWPDIRCGSKTEASTATITTDFPIESLISRVDVEITLYASGTTNSMASMALLLSPNADMTDATVYPADISNLPTALYTPATISIPVDQPVENMYYQLRIEMPKVYSSGSTAVNSLKYFEPAPEETPGIHSASLNFSNPEELLKCYGDEKEIAPGNSYSTDDSAPNNLNGTSFTVDDVRVTISKGDDQSASLPRWYESTGNLKISPELRLNPGNVITFETTTDDRHLVEVQFVQGNSAESNFNNLDSTTAETNLGESQFAEKKWQAAETDNVTNLTLTFNGYCRCNGINIVSYVEPDEENVGIRSISAGNSGTPAEYFTLSGLRAAPTRPGLYIKRQGSASTKILIK